MGNILECYQFKTNNSQALKEMIDMSPKCFYQNSYSISRKFLGEGHPLTHRLHFCRSKTEFLLFKEIQSNDNSETEKDKTPKKWLKYMVEDIAGDNTNPISKPCKSFRAWNFSPNTQSKPSLRTLTLEEIPKFLLANLAFKIV